jgi:hypothetical protein
MNRHLPFLACLIVAGLFLTALPGHAEQRFTAKRLNQLDKLGAFPPEFKKVAHDYVDVIQAINDTNEEEKKLLAQVPGLEQQAAGVQAKVDALHVVLADYDHTDESDFVLLQNKMNDAAAKTKDQLLLAQVFVWSYPASPHLPQAQAYLQQVQKLIADRLQAEKDAAAAIAAARAQLLQRVHDRALSLDEWKAFLNNLTQADVIKYLGSPPQQEGYYWTYPEPWALDPVTNQKTGLQLNFNGGRVINVVGVTARAAPTSGSSSD